MTLTVTWASASRWAMFEPSRIRYWNVVVPKKSLLGLNVTRRPSVAAVPPLDAPTDVTVSPWPSGSMSLASTATVTGVAWFVVAESGRACGGGASGAATVRFTVAVADSPPESVTVYWNESVPPAWSIAAVARTVGPVGAELDDPAGGGRRRELEGLAGVGVLDQGGEVDVRGPTGLDLDVGVGRRWRAVARREHVHGHRAGDDVALLVVGGVGERRPAGEAVVGVEPHGQLVRTVRRRAGGAPALAVAAHEVQRVAVRIGRLAGEVDGDRLVGRRLDLQRLDRRRPVVDDEHGELGGVAEPGGVGHGVAVPAGTRLRR